MWGIFNDESANWTEAEAVEADFYTREEAEDAIAERYSDEDELVVHEIEDDEDAEEEMDECSAWLEHYANAEDPTYFMDHDHSMDY